MAAGPDVQRASPHVLSTPCRIEGVGARGAKAKLLPQRILLTGWKLSGRYRREIVLSSVGRVEWLPAQVGTNLVLYLRDGTAVGLELKRGVGAWKYALEDRIGGADFNAARPDDQEEPGKAA